jgi:hypothetical protein
VSCIACSAGTYSSQVGASSCLKCGRGQYQPSTGQDLCIECTAGKYASEIASLSCTNCDIGYNSKDTAVRCDLADIDYYLKPNYNDKQSNESVNSHTYLCVLCKYVYTSYVVE